MEKPTIKKAAGVLIKAAAGRCGLLMSGDGSSVPHESGSCESAVTAAAGR